MAHLRSLPGAPRLPVSATWDGGGLGIEATHQRAKTVRRVLSLIARRKSPLTGGVQRRRARRDPRISSRDHKDRLDVPVDLHDSRNEVDRRP